MIQTKVLVCLLVLYVCGDSLARKCDSCMLLDQCPEAPKSVSSKNNAVIQKLKEALCGTTTVDGKRHAMICCADYTFINDRFGASESESPKDSIENHPNVALLPKDCGKIGGDRIIGGTVANLYEFPWMALIAHKTRILSPVNGDLYFKCGGTVINSRYILTAAHCVVHKKLYKVRIGELDLGSKEDCQGEYPNSICEDNLQDISIEESIPHEEYHRMPTKNDIALLRLKEPIDFGHKNAAPICLPVSNEVRNVTLVGKVGTIAGWGTTENGTDSLQLRKVDIPILPSTSCYEQNTEATPTQFCAGESGKDSCKGDSGGPLIVQNEVDGKYKMIQYGIVSYGPKACGSAAPGVYTNVANYMDWILSNIRP